ncbi:MAG: glycosyltransferase family 9 protein [Thermoleophilaceae bacterium]
MAVEAPRLLILRALGLGDLLTAVPALRALARSFPGHRRVLAAPRALRPLVDLVGAVDEIADVRGLATPLPRGADIAVNLHGRGPQSHRLLVEARPRRLIAFHHDQIPLTDGMPEWRPGEHEVSRWCRLLSSAGVAADPSDLRLAHPEGEPPEVARGAVLIHPGAASEARRWPAERWAAVARAQIAAGRHVAVTGGPEEVELARAVASKAGLADDAVLAGRTDLAHLARAVAAADRIACGDTGIAHLATALGTPSVVLFGPTPPSEWGPPAHSARHRALWSGGRGDPHAARPDPGLLEIEPETVISALGA